MDLWYEPLLDVSFEHTYYDDNRCGDFIVRPTPDTQAKMRSLQLVLKPHPTGFRLYCRLDPRVSTPGGFYAAVRQNSPLRLQFYLILRNAWFDNFTALPADRAARQILYASNRVHVSGATPDRLLLGEAASNGGVVGPADFVEVAGDSFTWLFDVPAAQSSTQVTWLNMTGEIVRQEDFAQTGPGRVRAHFEKLYLLPNGLYRLSATPTPIERIVYKDAELAQSMPFGLIEIFSHPAHADYLFQADETVSVGGQNEVLTRLTPQTYRLQFERRVMPWQFQVVRRANGPDPANLQVVYGPAQAPYPVGVTFTESAVPSQPDRRLFRSDHDLPFFQTPKRGLELQHKNLPAPIEPLPNLPNPSVAAVRRDAGGNFFAESVIYI